MLQTAISVPVTIEQIAAAIQQMTSDELNRLLEFTPALRKKVSEPPPLQTLQPWPPELDGLRAQVMAALGNKPLRPDEPFMGGLTIAEYDALSEEEKDALWDELAEIDPMEMEEVEVIPNAVLA